MYTQRHGRTLTQTSLRTVRVSVRQCRTCWRPLLCINEPYIMRLRVNAHPGEREHTLLLFFCVCMCLVVMRCCCPPYCVVPLTAAVVAVETHRCSRPVYCAHRTLCACQRENILYTFRPGDIYFSPARDGISANNSPNHTPPPPPYIVVCIYAHRLHACICLCHRFVRRVFAGVMQCSGQNTNLHCSFCILHIACTCIPTASQRPHWLHACVIFIFSPTSFGRSHHRTSDPRAFICVS